MKTIRVLHIAQLHEMGGIQTRLLDLLSQPVNDFEFYVFSPNPITPFLKKQLRRFEIHFCQVDDEKWKDELVRYAVKSKIDIAHFHQPWPKAKAKLKKNGIKIIVEHDQGASWYHQAKIRSNLKTVDAVIALSKASRVMLEKMGYPRSKIHLIYYGINFNGLKATAPIPRPHGKKVITTVCRLVSIKGLDSLLKAIPVVLEQRTDVEFWIVGDGPLREHLLQIAERLGIMDYVKFWGNQTAVANFYASTDLFILPSVREPLGSVLLEAAYFGIPAIGSNVDGIPEIIIPGKTGVLINPTAPFQPLCGIAPYDRIPKLVVDGSSGELRKPYSINPLELGAAILDILAHPELSQAMGAEARMRVCRLYNLQRYRRKIIQLYLKLLKEKGVI